jgi:CRP-like cAMP-binding protein
LTFTDGDTIVAEGDEADNFFVIADGEIAVTRRTPEGQEIELAVLGPGQFFGEGRDPSRRRGERPPSALSAT